MIGKKMFGILMVFVLAFSVSAFAQPDGAERPIDADATTEEVDEESPSPSPSDAMERGREHIESVTERIRERNPEAADNMERIHDRMDEARRRVMERVDEDRIEALVSGNLTDEQLDRLLNLPEREIRRMSPDEIRDMSVRDSLVERQQRYEEMEERGFRQREVAQEAREDAQQRAQQARERAEQARERAVESRGRFNEQRERISECVQNPGPDCADVSDVSKEHINNTIDYLRDNLDSVASRIESSERIDDERASELLDRIESLKSSADSLLEDLEDAEDFEDVRELGREANSLSQDIRSMINEVRNRLSSGTLNGVIAQISVLERRLDRVVYNLEDRDISTEDIESLMDDFSDEVEEARSVQEEIDELMEQDVVGPERGELMRDVASLRQDAVQRVRDARDTLAQIYGRVREISDDEGIPYGELVAERD